MSCIDDDTMACSELPNCRRIGRGLYIVIRSGARDTGDRLGQRAVRRRDALRNYGRTMRPGLWRNNIDAIKEAWEDSLVSWIDPQRLPPVNAVLDDVARRLRELQLD